MKRKTNYHNAAHAHMKNKVRKFELWIFVVTTFWRLPAVTIIPIEFPQKFEAFIDHGQHEF